VILWRLIWEMLRDSCPEQSARTRLLAGAWAAALSSGMLVFSLIGQVATTDGPLMFFWALLMLLFWRAQHQRTNLWAWALWGGVLALAVLSKYTGAAAMASAVWLVMRQRDARQWLGLTIAALVCALLLIPHVLWNQNHGWPTLRHTSELLMATGAVDKLGPLNSVALYLVSQIVVVGPVVIAAAALFALHKALRAKPLPLVSPSDKKIRSTLMTWAWAWAWPLWLIGGIQSLTGQSQMNWPAPAVLGLAVLMALWRLGMPGLGWRGPWMVLLFGMLTGAIVSLGGDWRRHFGVQGQGPRWDLWSRARGWDDAFAALTPHIKAHPGAQLVSSERAVIAHASYAWRDQGWRPLALPAAGLPEHHYQMIHAFDSESASKNRLTVLWITSQPAPLWPSHVSAYAVPQLLFTAQVSGRALYLWRLDPA
jgi:hypothetical protein